MEAETTETTEPQATEEMDAMMAGLDAAVDSAVGDPNDETGETDESAEDHIEDEGTGGETPEPDVGSKGSDDDEAPGGESPGDEEENGGDEGGASETEKTTVSDDLLVRAINAGLSPEQVRQAPNDEFLVVVCDKLESAAQTQGESDSSGVESDDDMAALLADIPDLEDTDYDDDLKGVLSGMKKYIVAQDKKIAALSVSADQRTQETWFKLKVSGLDDAASKALKSAPEKLTVIQEQFNILEAGHEASGKEANQDAIFGQAVMIALGDDIAKVKAASKGKSLQRRVKSQIARPEKGTAQAVSDPIQATIDEIGREFYPKG